MNGIPDNGIPRQKIPGLITPGGPEIALAHKFMLSASSMRVSPIEVISAAGITAAQAFAQLPIQARRPIVEKFCENLKLEILGEKEVIRKPLNSIDPT